MIWQILNLTPFWAPDGPDIKNNGRFGFGIPQNIRIDIWIVQIEHIEFYPFFGTAFQPLDKVYMKNKSRFIFGIPRNIEIDTWIVPIEHFEFYYFLPTKFYFFFQNFTALSILPLWTRAQWRIRVCGALRHQNFPRPLCNRHEATPGRGEGDFFNYPRRPP